jgi:hypothetical protein
MSTHNVTGNHVGDTSLNLTSTGSSETINVHGSVRMNLSLTGMGDQLTVNLKPGSKWTGGVHSAPFDAVKINGPGQFANVYSSFSGNTTIGSDVVGTGTIIDLAGHGPNHMEFVHGVSSGQTVVMESAGYPSAVGTVQIDDPKDYHALTELLGPSEVVLEGLKATSYSVNKAVISLWNGNHVIDTIRAIPDLTKGGNLPKMPLSVSQIGGSVVIDDLGIKTGLLPVHV